MLGTFRLSGDDATVTRFRTRRVALLLAHLAVFRNRLHFRDEVGELLWPEREDEVIRRNLRQALSSLRHVLEPPSLPFGSVLQVQQARLRLNPDVVGTDVAEFERAIADARKATSAEQVPLLRKAISLYAGELLPEFDEDWILHERLRLEDQYVDALRRLIELSRAAGNSEEAIELLLAAIEREPYTEEWHVALMQEYLQAGRPAAAVMRFETMRDLLEEHLHQSPSSLAVGLYEKCRSAATNHVSPNSVSDIRKAKPEPLVQPVAINSDREGHGRDKSGPAVRLPVQLTRFCGRQEEIERSMDQLLHRRARLTSLIGPAGTGKTRLAVEIGRQLAETGHWNVWFVPMADFATGAMLTDAVLDTLNVRRSGRQDPLDRLEEALKERERSLLILDNAEHLIDDVTLLVERIVERTERLQVLVTSRQTLRLAAEHQVPIPPLPIPFGTAHVGAVTRDEVAELAGYPSIQLFVDRCQTIRPDFQLTVHNARAVAAICAKLEGIPLAIELAAGLSGSFAPSQMVFQLQRRLTVLTSRRRDIGARHRSLRAAIEYSYDTLSPKQQRVFAALSVFRGGFSLEAAAEVAITDAAGEVEEGAELIWELQERSLVHSESSEELSELRFRMLESFREYADERLGEIERRALRLRHAQYYRQRPVATPQPISADERTRRHLWIESEFDNYIAAIDFHFEAEEYEECIELFGTLSGTWSSRGPRAVERTYIRRIAERTEDRTIDPNARILLLRMLGTTHIRSAEYAAAYRACHIALGVAERNQLDEQIAVCHLAIATCAGYLGNLSECLVMSEKALARLPAENLAMRERAYLGFGAVHWGLGNSAQAEEAFLKAAEISAQARGGEADVLILGNLARVCLDDGRFDEAMTRLGEAMRICRRLHDDFGLAICLTLVGRYYWLHGQLPAALANGHEAIKKFRETDFLHYSLHSIFQHALVITDTGAWESATMLLAATQGIGKAARLPDHRDHLAAVEKIRVHLSEDAFERAWAKGLAMGTEEAFRLALNFR